MNEAKTLTLKANRPCSRPSRLISRKIPEKDDNYILLFVFRLKVV